MTASLKKPAAAKLPKRTRTEWDELIRRREQLDADRKRLDRESAELAKSVGEIDDELLAFVESESGDAAEKSISLKSFIVSIIWPAPSAMAVAFAALRKLTKEDAAELKDSLPKKRKLTIQWRDAPPPAAAAAA